MIPIISGVGTGIALTSGCCGGGLDIIGLYMSKKGVKITVGQFGMVFNFVLFALCWMIQWRGRGWTANILTAGAPWAISLPAYL